MDNKTLIDTLAIRLGMSPGEVTNLTNGLISVITESLLDLDSVVVPAFGNFEARKRKERVTVHPSTGKKLLVPPKIVVGFKPSTILKNRLRDSDHE